MFTLIKGIVANVLKEDNHGCSTNCQKDLPPLKNLPKPVIRQMPLTPSPSDEVQIHQQTCHFFSKLPCEIRRLILVQAFGERTLHMDLQDYKDVTAMMGSSSRHYGIQTRHTLPVVGGCGPPQHKGHPWPPRDHEGYQWLWWSSVCHRNPPVASRGSMGARDGQSRAPWDDDCLNGNARNCTDWGRPGLDCTVGAMGFLRSCRQAYAEGLEVLYKTNSIHIANSTLFPRLPRLIIPDRLSDITCLEIVWEHHDLRPSLWGPSRSAQMPLYLHILSEHLTGLQRLLIAVVKTIHPPHADIDEDVLQPLDAFVRNTPRLKEVSLSFPWVCFSASIVGALQPTPKAVQNTKSGEKFTPLHVWRPLSDACVAVQVTESTYPDAPRGMSTYRHNGGLAGYWIVEGHDHDSVRDIHLDDPA